MSVFVSDFGDGTVWTVTHDDAGHSGSIDPTTVQHPLRPDGTPDHNFALVVCPVCGAVSTHPVGGGAQPESVQKTFIRKQMRDGCPCGKLKAGASEALARAHAKKHAEGMDGRGRWQLDGVAL